MTPWTMLLPNWNLHSETEQASLQAAIGLVAHSSFNLVGLKYIHRLSTHGRNTQSNTPTKIYFSQKITQILILETIPKQRHGLLICVLVIDVTWQTDFINITGLMGRRKQISIAKHTAVRCIWNIPGCSAMFHVPGFINFQKPDKFYSKLKTAKYVLSLVN